MTTENAVRLIAGTFVVAGAALAHFLSPWWLLLTAFMGLNLIQSAFTGVCPGGIALVKLGIVHDNRGVPAASKP